MLFLTGCFSHAPKYQAGECLLQFDKDIAKVEAWDSPESVIKIEKVGKYAYLYHVWTHRDEGDSVSAETIAVVDGWKNVEPTECSDGIRRLPLLFPPQN